MPFPFSPQSHPIPAVPYCRKAIHHRHKADNSCQKSAYNAARHRDVLHRQDRTVLQNRCNNAAIYAH